MKRIWFVAPTLVLAGLLLAACGSDDESPADIRDGDGDRVTVELRGVRFVPDRLEIAAGTAVTFVNRDSVVHDIVNATPDDVPGDGHHHGGHGMHGRHGGTTVAGEAFHSPHLGPDEEWAYVFEEPGTYSILCTVDGHYLGGMVGEIVVVG